MSTETEILSAAETIKAGGLSKPVVGRDPINQPMINNWVEAMGDTNPVYVDDAAARAAGHDGIVAPPAMAQVWTMRGLNGQRAQDDPLGLASQLFDDAGYTSVVATNCDSTYHRYTRPGEQVSISSELLDVVGPKNTALGEGWFFTTRNVWTVDDEVVAEMLFRILKFRPPSAGGRVGERSDGPSPAGRVGEERSDDPSPAGRVGEERSDDPYRDPAGIDHTNLIRPTASRDTQFFWDGVNAHELRIQQRPDGTLQHPPVPAVWTDRNDDGTYAPTDYVVSSGRGTVYSYVVHHAPRVPGRELPFIVALVEIDEGVRMLGQLRGVDPSSVTIGDRVQVEFLDFPADADTGGQPWTLYAWQPLAEGE
ncbi:DNA-binding protein [Gordonia sp. TBRC 11910]|uniref:DNA-binding protein n=1 Tax=Gordonia asplenii TaxID=2725283 RepID=A0A848KWX0_9ACTN|nr:OB-fold domain-containing protein [Gordonia asplenii]NMO00953.1 DNA-binding protein [Gordonia asplenii]